jgi:hypothetical protein
MYRTFGDLFMYRDRVNMTDSRFRVFKNCVMLKSSNDILKPGKHVKTICVCMNGELLFKGVENETDDFIIKNQGIPIITEKDIDTRFLSVVSDYDDVVADIDDFYGGRYNEGDDNDFLLLWWVHNVNDHIDAIQTIMNQFRKSISDPSYKMCRNRLMREFSEMNF